MKALILAAGYATRLYPLTLDTPKALLDIGGRPLLDWLYDKIVEVPGVEGVHVVTNNRFAEHFELWAAGREDVTVHDDGTLSNDDRLGAIGDIGFVIERAKIDDDLLVLAGDNLFSSGLEGFVAAGQRHAAPVLAVHDVGDPELIAQLNTVEADASGRITYFEEKPERATSTIAGIALYWYPRAALSLVRRYLDEGHNPDQPGRLIEWLYPQTPVYVWELTGDWYDIGTPEQLELARTEFVTKSAR
jgi:glucose-1-phosphate thymidylyltransferase